MAVRALFPRLFAVVLLAVLLLCAGTGWTEEREAASTGNGTADGAADAPPAANATAVTKSTLLSIHLTESTTGRSGVNGNQANYGDLETDLVAHWGDWLLGYEHRDFFWNNTSRLEFADGGGTPWNVLHRYYVARTLFDGEDERFDYYAGVVADTAFEAQPDDATGLGGFGHLAVNIYEGVKFGVEGGISAVRVRGGDVFTRSDLRARLELPETRIRKWLLRQVDLPDEKGLLGFGVEYLSRRRLYRLADDSHVKGQGYVDMNETSIGLATTVRVASGFELRVIPRYYLPSTLNFYNRRGENVGRLRAGHSWGGALELDWTFGE